MTMGCHLHMPAYFLGAFTEYPILCHKKTLIKSCGYSFVIFAFIIMTEG